MGGLKLTCGRRLPLSAAALLLVSALLSPALAHEPVFSLGPETIFQDGIGVEAEIGFEDKAGEKLSLMNYEVIYGLREYLSLTLSVPHILERKDDGGSSSGLGDIELRVKYRFYKKDMLGAQHKISSILGVKASTGNEDTNPALGTGTTDVLFAATYGYESRTWYHFLTTRYRYRTETGTRNPGDRLFIDGAVGYRPWRREYLEWDFVGLLETNLELEFKDEFRDSTVADTAGNRLWLGPTGLLSYRNVMFKGGVQFPVYEDHNGDQDDSKLRAVFAVEYHF
jgi:hypothetical protein